jgi:hypothetical protein
MPPPSSLSPVSLVGSYMRNEETGCRRNSHSEVLHNLYVLPDIVRMIKSSRKGAGHIAHMREKCIQSFVHYCFKIMCKMGLSVVIPQSTCIWGGNMCVEN